MSISVHPNLTEYIESYKWGGRGGSSTKVRMCVCVRMRARVCACAYMCGCECECVSYVSSHTYVMCHNIHMSCVSVHPNLTEYIESYK